MLTISDISKSFGGRTLFRESSLQVNRGDRVGLVGPNGAGKSTLFSLILRLDQPDTGSVNFERGITVGFLPQESAPAGDETVIELATAITSEFAKIRKWVLADDAHTVDQHTEETADYHNRFNELDGYQLDSKAKRILAGLAFREKDFDRPAREMSGGWVMRAHLARLLVQEPDLLMLDEPTNHLDLSALLWVQEYLKGYPGAILMISHDREFLNQLVGSIVEIRQSQLIRYRGTYEDYLVQRAANEAQLLSAYKNQQREIGRMMDFVDRFRAKNTKAAQAQSKLKQIERMDKIEAPVSDERGIGFEFPQPERSGQKVITLKDIHQAYGNTPVYTGMDFLAERGQRVVLVGPNGAGKSTLLKILAGSIPFQAGSRDLGHNVKFGYYAQYRVEMLNPEHTVLEEALNTPQRVTEQFVRTVLGSFLFRGDDVFKRVSVLSGGEKSRLALVKLLLDPPNLLLMDEPTTHLDMNSIDALLGALQQYAGTIIFISHDVYFIRGIANHVVHVNGGRLTHYSGDYQYYLDKTAATSAREALFAPGSGPMGGPVAAKPPREPNLSAAERKERKRREAEERQGRSKGRRARQEAVTGLEKQIATLEAREKELTAELEKPEVHADGKQVTRINQELREVLLQLPKLTAAWEKAAHELAEGEKED